MVALVLEGLEFANIVYKGREGVDMIMEYVTGPLLVPYFILQFAIGAITPILAAVLHDLARHDRQGAGRGRDAERCLVLFSVFMMRWNVVIGGQEISKTGEGLLTYHLPLFGKEGADVSRAGSRAAGLLLGMTRLFPPWDDHVMASKPRVAMR